jgi:fructose-bisphosphate aldolase class I
VPDGRQIAFKLSIPTKDDLYADLIEHPKVLRVIALSGGYSQEAASTT